MLQFNGWIASGYRANLSYKQCACTLFAVHNETGALLLQTSDVSCPVHQNSDNASTADVVTALCLLSITSNVRDRIQIHTTIVAGT